MTSYRQELHKLNPHAGTHYPHAGTQKASVTVYMQELHKHNPHAGT